MFKSWIQLQSGYLKTTSNLSDRLEKSNLYFFILEWVLFLLLPMYRSTIIIS